MRYVFKKPWYTILFSIVDALGAVVFFPVAIKGRGAPLSVKNILVVRLDHVGDVVCATAVARNLKAHYKDSRVTFLAAGWAKELLSYNPFIDEVIVFDAPWFDRSGRGKFSLGMLLGLLKTLSSRKFDLAFELRGDFRNILLLALAGIPFRVGYDVTGGGFLLHKKASYDKRMHAFNRNLELLKLLEIPVVERFPQLYASPEDKEAVELFLKGQGITANDFLAVLHPVAGYPAKNWINERFSELMRLLEKRYAARLMLIGAEKDKGVIQSIIEKSGVKAVNAAGRTNLGMLVILFKQAHLFIGVDSGPAHMAAASSTPTVVLYSGTNNAQEWAPQGARVTILKKQIDCQECEKKDCPQRSCMEAISVAEVMDAVNQAVQQ